MKKLCDACGSITPAGVSIGGAYICRDCDPDIHDEITRLRAAGERVNVRHIAKRMLRERNGAGTWLMQDPPAEMWQAAKDLANKRGISMRELVILAVHEYVNK